MGGSRPNNMAPTPAPQPGNIQAFNPVQPSPGFGGKGSRPQPQPYHPAVGVPADQPYNRPQPQPYNPGGGWQGHGARGVSFSPGISPTQISYGGDFGGVTFKGQGQPIVYDQPTVATPTAQPIRQDSGGNDYDHGNNDDYSGSQTGAQTSYSNDNASFADDAAVSDQGGGGGGGGGTYCCTASVEQGVMTNRELYGLHKWHHSQSAHWITGYDIYGKWVADNLVSKYKYFAHLTKAFYDWKVNGKFTFKALQAALVIYPGVIVAGFKREKEYALSR